MGFLGGIGGAISSVGSAVGNAVSNTVSNPVGWIAGPAVQTGMFAGNLLGGMPGSGPGPMQESPEQRAARERQKELIKQQEDQMSAFDQNRQGMYDRALRGQDTAVRRALQNRLRGVKESAQSRGLLFSGIKEGAEANTRGAAAQEFASNRYSLNKSFDSMREKMQNVLDRLKLNQYEESVIMADNVYDQALRMSEQDRGMLGNIMGAAGTIGGFAAASRDKPDTTNTGFTPMAGFDPGNSYQYDYSGSPYGGKGFAYA